MEKKSTFSRALKMGDMKQNGPDKVFVTGASGNVGKVTATEAARLGMEVTKSSRARFNFLDSGTFDGALEGVSSLFLMRPPHISNVKKDMLPFLERVKESNVQRVVFLSLQGAEQRDYLPHRKIELALEELDIPSTFLRPAFFMENLSTVHKDEIAQLSSITVPAGKALFNFASCNDIGRAAAVCLAEKDPGRERFRAYTLTGPENLNYKQVAALLTEECGRPIEYHSPNPLLFFLNKWKEGNPPGLAVVMSILYYSRRFGADPDITDDLFRLTGNSPMALKEFIHQNRHLWLD